MSTIAIQREEPATNAVAGNSIANTATDANSSVAAMKIVNTRDQSILQLMKAAQNNTSKDGSKPRTSVADLHPSQPVGRVEVLILRRYPRRVIRGEKWTGSLAAACGRDESGLVGVVLWGDQVEQVSTGDVVRIEDGWCRISNGEKVVSTGRNGRLTVLQG